MVNNKESGSLYLRTDDNRSGFIGIRQGEIETVVSGNFRGLEAMKVITGLSSFHCRKDSALLSISSGDLPSTHSLVNMLKLREVNEGLFSAGQEVRAEETVADAPAVIKTLCELMHDYIGPAAPIVCDDITQGGKRLQHISDLDGIITDLAKEIGPFDEAEEFKRRVNEEIGSQYSVVIT